MPCRTSGALQKTPVEIVGARGEQELGHRDRVLRQRVLLHCRARLGGASVWGPGAANHEVIASCRGEASRATRPIARSQPSRCRG